MRANEDYFRKSVVTGNKYYAVMKNVSLDSLITMISENKTNEEERRAKGTLQEKEDLTIS